MKIISLTNNIGSWHACARVLSTTLLAPEPALRWSVENRVTWAVQWSAGFSRPDAPAEASAP